MTYSSISFSISKEAWRLFIGWLFREAQGRDCVSFHFFGLLSFGRIQSSKGACSSHFILFSPEALPFQQYLLGSHTYFDSFSCHHCSFLPGLLLILAFIIFLPSLDFSFCRLFCLNPSSLPGIFLDPPLPSVKYVVQSLEMILLEICVCLFMGHLKLTVFSLL